MARKWLSGALAFAMIFGCSAPVALAEETPVEVVEQESLEEVEQESLEGVEQYAIYNPNFAKSEYELVAKAGSKVTLELQQAPNVKPTIKIDGTEESKWSNYKATWNSNYTAVTIEVTGDINAGSTRTVTVEYPKEDESKDTYLTYTASTKIKLVAAEDLTVTPAPFSTIEVEAGSTKEVVFSYGADKKPYNVTIKPTTNAATYVSYEIVDAKNSSGDVVGTKVIFTGIKETTNDVSVAVKISVTPTASSGVDSKWNEKEVKVVVTKATTVDAVTRVSAKADKSTIVNNDSDKSTIIAQAYKADAYGDDVSYDNAKLNWSVNGTALEFKDGVAKIMNVLGDKAELTVTKGAYDGIIYVTATKAGTYTFVVTPADNPYMSYPVTITVKENETANSLTIKDNKNEYPLALGGSLNLDELKWQVNDDKTLADFGATIAYEIKGASGTNAIATTDAQAEAIASIAGGVLKVANLDNTMLSALFAKDDTLNKVAFKVVATGKIGTDEFDKYELTVFITKSENEANGYVIYVDGEKLDGSFPALTVGVPTTIKVEVVDKNGFSDAVAQDVVFDTAQNSADETVYLTYTQTAENEIVVTPLVSSVNKVSILWTAVSNPSLTDAVNLVIKANTNPTPTATPEPSPTTEPSTTPEPSPTAAPVVRTGVVVNVSSNLNIREAATTSSTVVTKVKNGTNLVILGEEGNFYKVQLADGKIGYASKDYVRETTDTPVQPTGDYAIVTTKGGRLNMRQTAGGAVITSIANGTRVDVISEGSEWTLIEYNGRQGYVSTGFLTIYHGAVG